MERTPLGLVAELLSMDGDRTGSPKRFNQKTGRWIMHRIVTVILTYHRHKPTELSLTEYIPLFNMVMNFEGIVAEFDV
jgi:hypothetical protein